MENEISLTGMVLKDMPVGEYDKRISLLTLERGRISAFLRGAKRPKGSSFSSIGPFCFGKFFVYEGRNSYTVRRVEISERFEKIQSDLTNVAYGSYLLDVAEYYSRENSDEHERLKLVYQSLRALSSEKFTKEFVRLVYELKNIAVLGEYPNIFTCTTCGKTTELEFFSFEKRIAYCKDCAKKDDRLYHLSDSIAYALWFIFATPIEKLYSFKLSNQAMSELRAFTDRYKSLYFKHQFKTLDFLSVLCS